MSRRRRRAADRPVGRAAQARPCRWQCACHFARRFPEAEPRTGSAAAGRAAASDFGGRPNGSLFAVGGDRRASHCGCCSRRCTALPPEERGVVTRFGRYSHTLSPGISLTLPAPIDRVQKVNVEEIRNKDIGSAAEETLMLTGDQNIIDIAYQVRWHIRDPEQYLLRAGRAGGNHPPGRRKRDAPDRLPGRPAGRDGRRARRHRVARPGRDAADARRLSVGRRDPGRGDQAGRSAGRGQRRLQGSHRGPAKGPERRQQRQRLCAAAAPERAGRGDRVRQGL